MNASEMACQRFPRAARLKTSAEFRRVFDRRASAGDRLMVVYGCDGEAGETRLGLSVSRRVGSAVVRNRWKRLIREAFRLHRDALPRGVDLVVVPRPGAQPESDGVAASLTRLAKRVAQRLEQREQ